MSGGTAFFSLVQTFRQRMRKCSGSPIPFVEKGFSPYMKNTLFVEFVEVQDNGVFYPKCFIRGGEGKLFTLF